MYVSKTKNQGPTLRTILFGSLNNIRKLQHFDFSAASCFQYYSLCELHIKIGFYICLHMHF